MMEFYRAEPTPVTAWRMGADGARCPESRTTLIVALIADRRLTYAAMGDSALFVSDGVTLER